MDNKTRSPLSKFLHCPEIANKVSHWAATYVPALPTLSIDEHGNLAPPAPVAR